MTEGINNKFNQKINQENWVKISVNTETEALPLFSAENSEEILEVDSNEFSSVSQIDLLNEQLEGINKEQGVVGSLWNGLKCLTNIGSSTEKCEKAIEKYKKGELSFEEASQMISEFQTKQSTSVNIFANVLTGLATVAAVGSAVATGGLSLGVIAIGAGVGAGTKAGLKFLDRATNKVEGDAADAKEITKDALSGAVDGAISVATMGLGTSAVTAKTVGTQGLKQTIIQGAKIGAVDGAISGSVTGATDYTIEAALEDDVDFDAKEMLKTSVVNGAIGGVLGGALGGITTNIKFKNMEDLLNKRQTKFPELSKEQIIELSEQSNNLHLKYSDNIKNIKSSTEDAFDNVEGIKITARPKSDNSIFDKLANKMQKGELTAIDENSCLDAIGDGIGTRIQIESLTNLEAEEIISQNLDKMGITRDDFMNYIKSDLSGYDDYQADQIAIASEGIIDQLKEKQTTEVVNQLVNKIKTGDVSITELNNYGNRISSYFTDNQLQKISDAYFEKTGKKLDVVTMFDYTNGGSKVANNAQVEYTANIKTDGAIKNSGYSSTQMNTKHIFSDGTNGFGELQIRGQELNDFADAEHIPYDIRKGKITEADTKYSDVYSIFKTMSKDSYKQYNTYLNDTYNWIRLKELGIELPEPQLPTGLVTKAGNALTDNELTLISRQGLINRAH